MKRNQWLGAVIVLAMLLSACAADSDEPELSSEDSPDAGEELAEGGDASGRTGKLVWAEPDLGIPPGWAVETDAAFVLSRLGIMESLVRVDFDGNVVSSLAETWEQVDDLTWAFSLRGDVRFHDGESLTADAVVSALTHVLATPTPPRGFNPDIVDAVEAEDDATVIVRTHASDELLPMRLSGPNTGILSPNAYGDGSGTDPLGTGTGPFVLVEQVRDDIFELVANEDYWDGEVQLGEIQVQIVPDGDVRAGLAQSGEADIIRYIPIPSIPVLEGASGVQLVQEPEARTETLYLNNASPVLSDVTLRQAILHAIDREALAESVLEGAARPATGPFPGWQPWADPDALTSYDFDPERSQQLLAEAGYEEGELSIQLWSYPARAYLPDLAVAIQGMLSAVGMQAEVRIADYVALEPDVLAGDYDLFVLSRGHLVDVYDPLGFLGPDYTCDGGYNLSHFCDPDFDAKVSEAAATADEETRWAIYRELTEELQANAVGGFLVHVDQVHATSDDVRNFRVHPVGHYLLTKDLSW